MSYETLAVWQRAIDLAVEARNVAHALPRHELFVLTAQIASSADSVPSNIAEGEGRDTRAERLRFLGYSRGSLYELETRLLVARKFGYSVSSTAFQLVREVKGLRASYMAYVKKTPK